MKSHLPYVLGLLFVLAGKVQAKTSTFGQPVLEELKMKVYPADSSAEAVVLSDIGSAALFKDDNRGYVAIHKRRVKIKILKKSALGRATVTVPLYRLNDNQQEVIDRLEGFTYNLLPDGSFQRDPLQKDAIFEERRTSQQYIKRFTLPNVREGSVIEYAYEMTSDFVFELPEWHFQQDVPVQWSEYRLTILPGFEYRILFQGYEPLTIDKSRSVVDGIEYHWAMKDLPGLREEPLMLSPENYRAKVWFELTRTSLPGMNSPRTYAKTWDGLDRTLITDENYGGALRRTNFLKPVAEAVLASAATTDTLQWIEAAHRQIARVMSWNKTRGLFPSRSGLKAVYEAKTGTATDLNMLLIGLLNEMGLEAKPVILSTKANGSISKEYPLLGKFDYTIGLVNVGGKELLLDATDPYLRPGALPVRCLNGEGRLVAMRGARWVKLTSTDRFRRTGQLQLAVQPDGSVKGTVTFAFMGYIGAEFRRLALAAGIDPVKQQFRTQHANWQWGGLEIANLDKPDEALLLTGQIRYTDNTASSPSRIYLRPLSMASLRNNPFKAPNRRYPVDMGAPQEEIYTATYTIPEGYTVEEAPKPVNLVLPDNGGRFSFLLQVTGNQIQVSSRLVLQKAIFLPQEYDGLRLFYDKVVAKHAEQLVLIKGQPVAQTPAKNE